MEGLCRRGTPRDPRGARAGDSGSTAVCFAARPEPRTGTGLPGHHQPWSSRQGPPDRRRCFISTARHSLRVSKRRFPFPDCLARPSQPKAAGTAAGLMGVGVFAPRGGSRMVVLRGALSPLPTPSSIPPPGCHLPPTSLSAWIVRCPGLWVPRGRLVLPAQMLVSRL